MTATNKYLICPICTDLMLLSLRAKARFYICSHCNYIEQDSYLDQWFYSKELVQAAKDNIKEKTSL